MAESEISATLTAIDPRPGKMLAEARARKSLTVLEVAQQLKLSASQIEALEADAYERLPGTVFVRGFVRNYARLVDLDGEAMVGALDLPHRPTTAIAAVPRSSNIPFPDRYPSNWPRYATALILLVGVLALYLVLIDEREVVVITHTPPASAPVTTAPATKPVTSPDPSQSTSMVIALPQETPAGQPVPTLAAPAPSSGAVELHFTFAAESWIEVRDRNNRILLSQLNSAGTEQRVEGRPPLSLVVGNAHGVRVTYKGTPIDLAPHIRVEVARLTLE